MILLYFILKKSIFIILSTILFYFILSLSYPISLYPFLSQYILLYPPHPSLPTTTISTQLHPTTHHHPIHKPCKTQPSFLYTISEIQKKRKKICYTLTQSDAGISPLPHSLIPTLTPPSIHRISIQDVEQKTKPDVHRSTKSAMGEGERECIDKTKTQILSTPHAAISFFSFSGAVAVMRYQEVLYVGGLCM